MRTFLLSFVLIELQILRVVATLDGQVDNKPIGIQLRKSENVEDSLSVKTDYNTKANYEVVKGEDSSMNFTKEELTALLVSRGYTVKDGSNGRLLGILDDVAFYPEDLLPELGAIEGRQNLEVRSKLWLDDGKETIVAYYFDTETKADQDIFEQAVKSWSDNTCIKFSKKPPNKCDADIGEPAVCVGAFGGCWSLLGRHYGTGKDRSSQKMSVQPGGCELVAAAHEFGHALGLLHEMARPDRDKHINVQFENIEVKLEKIAEHFIKHSWSQAGKFCPKEVYDAPKPYDPMSLMHYATSSFAGLDQRPVYLHKNPHYQYMFDYHRPGGYLQTHYDSMIVNLGYKCVSKWTKSCEDSGKSAPKCKNFGYLGKDCKCICPKGFSGSSCGSKDGPIFPVLDRAKAMLDISEPGLVDMKGKGMHDENHNYPRPDFNTCQFITVIIKSGEETRINVDVAHDFASIKSNFDDTVEMWMANDLECQYGMHVYIGEGAVGKMRTESISSLVNNEPEGYRPVLRSRTNELDIIGMAGWTLSFSGGPATVRKSMQFKFTVSFLDRPEDSLSVEEKNHGKFVGAVAEAQKMIQKAIHKNAILIVAILVLGLIMLASAYGYRRFQQEKTDEQPPDPEGSKEESQGSSSSDDDSDSSDSSD